MSALPEVAVILVPREPENPSPQEVYLAMDEGEPYTVGEITAEFPDSNRWTIKRRLDQLVEDGFVERKKHSSSTATYWIDL